MSKVYLDSNVVLRLVLADISKQFQQAKKLFIEIEGGGEEAYLSLLVVNEILWIAENYYQFDKKKMVDRLLSILQLKNIKVVEMKKSEMMGLLEWYKLSNVDLTDIYLAVLARDSLVASFDKDFDKLGVKKYRWR